MTNFKKGLSFSVFAVMALAFCLVIGQVVAGDLPTKAQLQQERNTGKSDLQEPGIQTTMDKSVVVPVETSGLKSVADVDDIEREKPARPRLAPQTVIDNGTPRTGGETIGTATVIGALPYVDDATTVGAVDDYDEACPDASTSADVVYAYTPTVTDTIVVSLCGSVLDTKVFVYENTTATLVDCNDDYCGYQSEIPFMEVIGGNTYYIVVDGWGGDEGPYHLEVFKWDPAKCVAGDVAEGELCGTQSNDGPVTVDNPVAGWGTIGANSTICGDIWAEGGVRDRDRFHYEVTNPLGEVIIWDAVADPINYFIQVEDSASTGYYDYDIGTAGAPTTLELYLGPGIYTIYITPNIASANCYGFDCGDNPKDLVDGNWRYRLSMSNRVINFLDDCEAPGSITAAGTYLWDLTGMTPGQSMPGFAGKNIFYEVDPPSVGIAHIEAFINEALVYHWGIAAGTECGGGAFALDYTGYHTTAPMVIEFPAIPGSPTILEVAAHAPASHVYTGWLDVTYLPLPPLTNDICLSAAVDLGSGDTGDIFFHNVEATWTYLPDDYYDQGMLGTDVWFTWTATANGLVEFTTCNSNPGFDSRAALYEGAACLDTDPRQPIAGDDDFCSSGGMSAFFFEATTGTSYLLRIGGWYQEPDYLPPSQGTGFLSFTEGSTFTAPANDDCADVVPFVLSPGVVVTETGTETNETNAGCLTLDPTVWHAFTPDTCMDVVIDYCGTTEELWWVADELLIDACPCYDANILAPALKIYTCTPTHKQLTFVDLLPKTYYFPVYAGVQDHVAESYTVNFLGTAKECDYCAATANPDVCTFGYEYIDGVVLETLSNTGNGCAGYQDFTGLTAPGLWRGIDHLLTITLGDAIGTDTTGVWVDWNQNFDIMVAADHVDTYSDGNGGEGPWFATLTPPLDAKNPADPGLSGYTLLRVRCNEGAVDDPAPCGTTVYGEVEDYIVEVLDWVCGDADGNGTFEQADVTFLVDMYFGGGAVPAPWQAGDGNGDGFLNIADIVYMAEALNGGTPPVCLP